jgi:hypothetical protein
MFRLFYAPEGVVVSDQVSIFSGCCLCYSNTFDFSAADGVLCSVRFETEAVHFFVTCPLLCDRGKSIATTGYFYSLSRYGPDAVCDSERFCRCIELFVAMHSLWLWLPKIALDH